MAVRIYGKTLEVWKSTDEEGRTRNVQYEIAYADYDEETGWITGVGSEDFSTERYHNYLVERWVWTWDGFRLNKGGHRRFECRGYIRFHKGDGAAVKRIMGMNYGATAVQLR